MAGLNDLAAFFAGIGALFTGIGVIVAINSMMDQIKLVRTGWQIDLLLKFEERFDSRVMLNERLKASKFLLQNPNLGVSDPRWSTVDGLVDFFQSIATFVEEGIMDKKFVLNFFGHWFLHYFKAVEPYIVHVGTKSPGTWLQALNLYSQIKEYDLKFGSHKGENISADELEEFFQWELRLEASHGEETP